MRPDEHSGRSLAYLGDAVWSLKIRQRLLEEGYGTGKQLQRLSIRYVSARAQALLYDTLQKNCIIGEGTTTPVQYRAVRMC